MKLNEFYIIKKKYVVIIVLLGASYLYHMNTLTTTIVYYLILLGFSLAVLTLLLLIIKVEKSNSVFIFLKTFLISYLVLFSFLFVLSRTKPNKTIHVHLSGYSTSNTDAIYFRLRDFRFKRYYPLTNYSLENITDDYDVELVLKQPVDNLYFIEDIRLKSINDKK